MLKSKILVLGAGLAGLSAAWHLQKKSIDCQVFEKESEVGGLCRSQRIGGFTFDYDGHLLHFRDKKVYDFIKDLLGNNLASHNRNSFIRYNNYEIPYPFQANFLKLPSNIAQECLEGFEKIAAKATSKKKYTNFKTWAYSCFGDGIARHFMIPYNEKFWNIPAEELTCDWLDGFVPKLKLEDVLNGSNERLGYNSVFYYPKAGGINELPNALVKNISDRVILNSGVTQIDLKKKKIMINNKDSFNYTKLISTIALPELKYLVKDLPLRITQYLEQLNYNSILVFNFGIKGNISKGKHWIYFPDKKFKYFRIGFYNSFSCSLNPDGYSSIYAEVSLSKNAKTDKERIRKEVIGNLINDGLISAEADIINSSVIDIKYGYPIYDVNYSKVMPKILKFLSSKDVYSIGRYGSWRYLSMEGAILEGRKSADLVYTGLKR